MMMRPRPLVLVIVDGVGVAQGGAENLLTLANITRTRALWDEWAHTQLAASGLAVGLPRREVGNTETGHLNIGAGRIVYQDLPRIDMAIADGSFFENAAFGAAIRHVAKNRSALHLLGLVGGGGVHSDLNHLYALLRLCGEKACERVFVHAITDGRDSAVDTAGVYLQQVQKTIDREGVGKLATVMGRYFAMDRDGRWERTAKAYYSLTGGEGRTASDAMAAVGQAYNAGKTDEFIEPTVIDQNGRIKDHDAVIFFNFRIDRPGQLTKAFVLSEPPFDRGKQIQDLEFVTMTEYQKGLPVRSAFPPQVLSDTLGEVLSRAGLRQLRMAESEKERFVTYYFNGLREESFAGEDREIVASPKVATYDLKPEMSAYQLTKSLVAHIHELIYDVIVVNYANPDMVGHTGNFSAAIRACEVVDECLGLVREAVAKHNGVLVITSDHGNVENLSNTEHDANPVPFILVGHDYPARVKLSSGVLADVAPTILRVLGIAQPPLMTGKCLLR